MVASIIKPAPHILLVTIILLNIAATFFDPEPTFPRWPPREGRLRARLPYGMALRNRILACWRFQPLLDAPIWQ